MSTPKNPRGIIEPDPKTGELKINDPDTPGTPADGERGLLMSDDAPNSYVTVKGSTVRFGIREMMPDELSAIRRRNTEDLAAHLGLTLEVVSDPNTFKAALRTLPGGADKWAAWQAETNLLICRNHLKNWTRPEPLIVDQLSPSVRFELAASIVSRSALGANEQDFLGVSSATS